MGLKRLLSVAAAAGLLAGVFAPSARASDPFAPRPLTPKQISAPSGPMRLHLDGVLITPYSRTAVINGRSLKPGQFVGGARLVKLAPGTATLVRGGHRFMLVIAPDPRKNPKAAQGAGQ